MLNRLISQKKSTIDRKWCGRKNWCNLQTESPNKTCISILEKIIKTRRSHRKKRKGFSDDRAHVCIYTINYLLIYFWLHNNKYGNQRSHNLRIDSGTNRWILPCKTLGRSEVEVFEPAYRVTADLLIIMSLYILSEFHIDCIAIYLHINGQFIFLVYSQLLEAAMKR